MSPTMLLKHKCLKYNNKLIMSTLSSSTLLLLLFLTTTTTQVLLMLHNCDWTKKCKIETSLDNVKWQWYQENSVTKVC